MPVLRANQLPTVSQLIRGINRTLPLEAVKTPDGKLWDCTLPIDEAAWWFDVVTKTQRFDSNGPQGFLNAAKDSWMSRYHSSYTIIEMQQPEFDPEIPASRMDLYGWLKGEALGQPALEENLTNFFITLFKKREDHLNRWLDESSKFIKENPDLDKLGDEDDPRVFYREATALHATCPRYKVYDFKSAERFIGFLWDCAETVATAEMVDLTAPIQTDGLLNPIEVPTDVSATFTKFKLEMDDLDIHLKAAKATDAKYAPKIRKNRKWLALARQMARGSIEEHDEALDSRKRGIQLRSFRNQRGLTLLQLAEIMVDDADLVGPDLTSIAEAEAEREKAVKARVTLLSRLETGAMQRGGFKRDVEEAICSALKCTSRELNQTPIGYHLNGADLILIDFRLRQDKKSQRIFVTPEFIKLGRQLSQDPSEWPEVFKRPDSRSQFSAFYVPPKNWEPLSDGDKVDLLRAAIQYHQPHSIKALEAMDRKPTVEIPLTQSDVEETAVKNVELVSWGEMKEGLPLFDYVTTSIDAGTQYTETGYAWNQEWFKVSTTATAEKAPFIIDPSSNLPDEVAKTVHSSDFPSHMNKDLPVVGYAEGGGYDMQFVDNGNAFDYIETPPVLHKIKNAFAVIVSNDSMSPRYEPGDYLYCDPNKVPTAGNYVVASLTDQRAVVKRFVSMDEETFVLKQLNPEKKIVKKREELVRLFVVVGTKTG